MNDSKNKNKFENQNICYLKIIITCQTRRSNTQTNNLQIVKRRNTKTHNNKKKANVKAFSK